jgi:uncharacterized alkaline shock family protein YloU
MLALGLCVALVAQGDVPAFTGKVKITRGAIGKTARVSLVTVDGTVRVDGELARELAKLASAKVEVRGTRDGDSIAAKGYTILEVSGVKPMVGYLVQTATGFAIKDGEGTDVPLSLPPRSRQRLTDQAGAKLWVYGKPLVSGELKVLKYGILRPPPTAPKTE